MERDTIFCSSWKRSLGVSPFELSSFPRNFSTKAPLLSRSKSYVSRRMEDIHALSVLLQSNPSNRWNFFYICLLFTVPFPLSSVPRRIYFRSVVVCPANFPASSLREFIINVTKRVTIVKKEITLYGRIFINNFLII